VAEISDSPVFASLAVTLLLVAWDQHVGVTANADILRRTPGRYAKTGDLSTSIDGNGKCQLQTGVGRNQAVQIDHGPVILPQERRTLPGRTSPGVRLVYVPAAGT
jgi:hypothetical protein